MWILHPVANLLTDVDTSSLASKKLTAKCHGLGCRPCADIGHRVMPIYL
jgi:hypothetical protein